MKTLKLKDGGLMNYRRLRQGDNTRIVNFHNALSQKSQFLFTPHGYDDESVAKIISRSEDDQDRVYIALDPEEKVVAYFFLWWFSSGYPVLGIGIADQYQGQGLGKQAMEILIEDARKGNCKTIELTTMLDNEKAFALYEKVGFKCLGQVDNLTGDGRTVKEWHMYYPIQAGIIPPEREHIAPA